MPCRRHVLALGALVWAVVAVAVAAAGVSGRVVTAAGDPIAGARIESGGESAVSDESGAFGLPEAAPPVELHVHHPRFVSLAVTLAAGEERIELVLEPKQELFEEIAVSARRGEDGFAPVSIAATVIDPARRAAATSTLTDVVATAPAVAENGQGGIFQTFSIRGVSRQRVLTLVSGMRIVGERRAGVSASFIDPLLMGNVEILRGPASTYYGSGALGGVVQLFPRAFDGPTASVGYQSQGDEAHAALGGGGRGASWGLARRTAGAGESAAGTRLNSGFEQTSGFFERGWEAGELSFRLLGIGSAGRDIGKANLDFPDRVTVYPAEHHLLLRLAIAAAGRWRLEAWAHPNDLETRVSEEEGVERVENEAVDLGLNFQRRLELAAGATARLGVDYFGRRGVDALETRLEPGGRLLASQRTLDSAASDELGLYGAVERSWSRATLSAGARFAWERQRNAGADARDDEALTGFVGLVRPLGRGFELAANAGTGLRFPSLSERFFTGVTGRGRVVGNPALAPERSLNADVGLRWYGERLFVAGSVFRNDIDDYIERVEVADGVRSFVNLISGRIEGVELEGAREVGGHGTIAFGAHALEGRGRDGAPLADVPADRLFVAGELERGRWRLAGRWEERLAKEDPGSGERAIGSASLLSALARFRWRPHLELALSARNLLDERYVNSADDQVSEAAGRSLGVEIVWTRPER